MRLTIPLRARGVSVSVDRPTSAQDEDQPGAAEDGEKNPPRQRTAKPRTPRRANTYAMARKGDAGGCTEDRDAAHDRDETHEHRALGRDHTPPDALHRKSEDDADGDVGAIAARELGAWLERAARDDP